MKRKRVKPRKPVAPLLKPKQATGGPVRVVDPETEERRLIQQLRLIATHG